MDLLFRNNLKTDKAPELLPYANFTLYGVSNLKVDRIVI